MSINPKIINKMNEKKFPDPAIRQFLLELLDIESEGIGWYKDKYRDLIEKYNKDGDNDESRTY